LDVSPGEALAETPTEPVEEAATEIRVETAQEWGTGPELAASTLDEGGTEPPAPAESPEQPVPELAATALNEDVAEPRALAETPEQAFAETVPESDEGGETFELLEPIAFSDEEWTIFREIMARFTRPVSFQQIFDTLREQRKEHNLARTNEQLRSMVKQAINSGMLERSGRGKRVYYTLKAE
ncbi:MAG: hypothetical protein ACPL8I_06130, partial [Chloroflexaceae bacterium]